MSSLPKRPFADVDVSEPDDPSTSTAPPLKKHYEKSRHNKRPKPNALPSIARIPTAKLLYPRISEPQITNVPFQQPLPLLTFSYTPDRVLHFDNSALRYLVPPPPEADLHHGLKTWEKKPDGKGRIDALLRAWTKVRKEDVCGMRNVDVGVVCWRGVMTKILTTPYETMDNWEMNVMLVDGTMYLEEHLTPERLKNKNNLVGKQRAMTYTGYAFESWCTSESLPPPLPPPGTGTGTDEPVAPVAPGWAGEPVAPPGWGGDVDTNVQWCSVVKTKLGNTRMVIGGEVDCVRGEYKGTNDTMVELKTSQVIRWPDDQRKFEKKLLKFYFQSFLLGVPEILVGFRQDKGEDKGELQLLQSFKTLEIPRMVRGQRKAWDPRVCLQ